MQRAKRKLSALYASNHRSKPALQRQRHSPRMRLMRIKDWRARGFAVGVAAHGIGTARAFQVNDTAGAFAGIGMGLNAMLTAILAPYLVSLML